MGAKVLKAVVSSVFLPEGKELRRLPKAPARPRTKKFKDDFEDRALVYDVFWHMDARQVLMVCPPAVNLAPYWSEATFRAYPGGQVLSAQFHSIRSTMTIVLEDVPGGTKQIHFTFAGQEFTADIGQNLAKNFVGARMIFTMSQNNPLHWMDTWARYHQLIHGADAVVVFDNGSSIYQPDDVAENLAKVPGIKQVLVVSIPFKYGPHDPAVLFNRFWANFLQVSTFTILLRRFGGRAFGVLNVDIDELAAPVTNSNIFEVARQSEDGFCSMRGRWVESIADQSNSTAMPDHLAFRSVLRDCRHTLNARKWVLDPSRDWLADLDVHPSPHRIKNMPREMARRAADGLFWHFKGINNNWKESRSRTEKGSFWTHRHPELKALFEQYLTAKNDQ
ncbi:MAG: hypothetical protein L3J13_01955 [Devosiaceae bacterium]|nr:hypothetical protein [Devosiaceae bacterium]